MDKIGDLDLIETTIRNVGAHELTVVVLTMARAIERWAAAEARWDIRGRLKAQERVDAAKELDDAKEALRALVKP